MSKSTLNVFQQLARIHSPGRADLHVHSTLSDGQLTPAQLIAAARAENLVGLAITDHDSTESFRVAREVVIPGEKLRLVCGVEMTCEFEGREVHLLGYGIDPDRAELTEQLKRARDGRRERFLRMAEIVRGLGAKLDETEVKRVAESGTTLSRRHLADLLVKAKQVSAIFYAFVKYLNRPEIGAIPKCRVPVEVGIRLIREAGGVSSWAHPPSDCTAEQIRRWRDWGLTAVEVEYPWSNPSHGKKLRAMAIAHNLLVTGGSDYHGAEPANRKVGSRGINGVEFEQLTARIGR